MGLFGRYITDQFEGVACRFMSAAHEAVCWLIDAQMRFFYLHSINCGFSNTKYSMISI